MVVESRRRTPLPLDRDTAWFSIIDADWPRLKAGYEAWLRPENFDESGQQKGKLTF